MNKAYEPSIQEVRDVQVRHDSLFVSAFQDTA
jgi:hypothetical protein